MKQFRWILVLFVVLLLTACTLEEFTEERGSGFEAEYATPINELVEIENFKTHALEHILEGEINRKGQAVGFHYDHLESKKGEIIEGSKTNENEHGVYEAKVKVEDVNKTSNQGKSSFFPDAWDTQDVVDAINEAYRNKSHINGNTYEGLTDEGIVIRMYLDQSDKIISAFPVY